MGRSRSSHSVLLFGGALAALLFAATVREAAQAAISINPTNPTITTGQTLQLTATGAAVPTMVAAGGEYTCVRLPDGSVRCAGRNQFGQLGDGSWTNQTTLVSVSGIASATTIAAGDEFACALLADGTAMCWGLGEKGQRGDGTNTQIALTPVAVQGLAGATALTAGYAHACALLNDTTVRCWGANTDGQLGDPSSTGSSVPIPVPNLTGVIAISAGAFHTCALMNDRTVECWGSNGNGQIGDGTTTDAFSPALVGGLSNVAAISGGGAHTCALVADGSLQCWGNNYQGQLGNGTTDPSPTPVPVNGIVNAAGVSAGWAHTCAWRSDGSASCWGENTLGNGTTDGATSPVSVTGVTSATATTSGWWHHSCVMLSDGGVRCWGDNSWGQFGNGTTSGSTLPAAMSSAVTWTSSDPSVATVDNTGRVTGVSAGITTVTATDITGASASTVVAVVRPHYVLTVNRTGLARDLGSVTSDPPGISCGSDCSDDYVSSTTVTLTASPGALATNWSGCDTVAGATCTVTLQSARAVTVTFVGSPLP